MRSAQLRVALDREAGGAYCSQAQDLAVDVNVSCSLNLIPQAGLLLRALQGLRVFQASRQRVWRGMRLQTAGAIRVWTKLWTFSPL
jgi:hypothetical protein